MQQFYNRALFLACLIFCIVSTTAHAQLPAFTLNVVPTDESCPENGSLAFTSTNTAPGASVLYNIFLQPNLTTPIATVGVNTLGGLSAGTYLVIATQTVNGQTSTVQQEVVINYTYQPVQYSPSINSCGGSTTLTIELTQGVAQSYEIISGPVTFPPQTSNVFTNLPDGAYQIRVYDLCGNAVAQPYVVSAIVGGLTIGPIGTSPGNLGDCNSTTVTSPISPSGNGVILYPLQYSYTFFPPSGPSFVVSGTVLSGENNIMNIIPYNVVAGFTYALSITDSCGAVYTQNGTLPPFQMTASISATPQQCQTALVVSPSNYVAPYTITFTANPPTFDPTLYNPNHPGPFSQPATYLNTTTPLPPGSYTVVVTDSCGHSAQATTTVNPPGPLQPLGTGALPGCDPGYGSILASSPDGPIVQAIITSAPAGFSNALPYDVSFNIAQGSLYMNSLLQGNYTLHTVDECGNVRDSTISIPGFQSSALAEVTPRCSGFDLIIQHQTTLIQPRQYWLQKLDPVTGQWGHPLTGNAGAPAALTAILLQNNVLATNIQATGSFRVMVTFNIFNNGNPNPVTCAHLLYSFEYSNTMQIENVYSFSCSPTSYDVIVEVGGAGPFIYRITKKNNVPFLINNGSSNSFYGLEPAIYTFEVEDMCGNVLTTVYDTTAPFSYVVTATQFCDGQVGTLSVPAFSFINYEWWLDGNPSVILSTSPTLTFNPVNSATDPGLYHVRIYAPDTTPSCIDFVLDYTLSPTGSAPNAGSDTVRVFCTNPGFVELTSLLSNSPETSGFWTDDAGNQLASSYWNASPLATGTYTFHYLVNGWCGETAESTLTIVLGTTPDAPAVWAEPLVCNGEDLQLNAEPIAGASYSWTGPNAFISSEQNPMLTAVTASAAGIYSVSVSVNGCESAPATVEVAVAPVPSFTLTAGCNNDHYYLTATAEVAFGADDTFSWSGPNGFTASVNPVDISNKESGIYTLTVTNADGCSWVQPIAVNGTACKIPQGISPNNDGDNDVFDLTGLDVKQLKIFNRYGMVVYDKLNYLKEWTGHDYRGHELPSATYYYWVRLGSGAEETGWVYLLR